MGKKEFIASWRGNDSFGSQQPNVWRKAQGSSLSQYEITCLHAGMAVMHPKRFSDMTKIFVMDEIGDIYSVIVQNKKLEELKKDLIDVGYSIAA